MKIFSSLVAFAVVFACLSVACADVALPPRPRNVQSDFVTADITDDGELSLKFKFPYECKYQYHFVEVWKDSDKEIHHTEIFSGAGKCKAGDIVEDGADLRRRLSGGEHNIFGGKHNFFVLTIETSDIKAKTRFGTKSRRDKEEITKTIIVSRGAWGQIYDFGVYDGDQTENV